MMKIQTSSPSFDNPAAAAQSWRVFGQPRRPGPLAFLAWLGVFPLLLPGSSAHGGIDAERAHEAAAAIQAIADDFRTRLLIPGEVVVTIVPRNDHLVSVERSQENPTVLILSFEEDFLLTLEGEEVKAAVAHEMGHVWIFHTHPFLQTEALANWKAEELVSRESLQRVYEKVWLRNGESPEPNRTPRDGVPAK
jgi:hypothetical protein